MAKKQKKQLRKAAKKAEKKAAKGKKKLKSAVGKKQYKRLKKQMRENLREQGFVVTEQMLAMARGRKAKRGKVVSVAQLFEPAKPPPGVVPKDTKPLAFDENISAFSAWGSNYFPSAFAEGQLFLGYPYLSELLQRGEYRRMVETIAVQMTRKWIKLTSTAEEGDDEIAASAAQDKIKKINEEMERIDVRGHFQTAAFYEEGMGRSHIFLDTGDSSKPAELTQDIGDGRDRASKGKVSKSHPLRRLVNVEPTWTYPSFYNATDPLDPSWYRPQEWYVMSKKIHASRLLTFIGRPVPDMLKPAYSFGGLSLVQMAKPYVDNWLRTRQSVSDITSNFSTPVLKTNLGSRLNPGGNALFFNRLELFNIARNNAGIMAVDNNTEDFVNVSTPLGSLDALQAQSQEHMAAISAIPLVFLLGITPQGLNASSEGEIRVFYDWIKSYQELLFRPNLTRIINFIQLSLFGVVDPSINFQFEDLWSMTEKEKAELKKAEAEADQIDINSGVLDPQERRQRLIDDPGSPYSSLNPEDVPDLLEEEEEGLEPKGAAAKVAEGSKGGEGTDALERLAA